MKNFFDKYPTELAQVIGTILVVVAIRNRIFITIILLPKNKRID
jgi:hypothetical protein